MKYYQFIILSLLAVLVVTMTGCEYDGPTAMYYQTHDSAPTPVITRLEPDSVAPAGVNYITILGENFAETLEDNYIYFNNIVAEIVNGSTTSIIVRRPNLVGDSVMVKVVSYDAIEDGKYYPYQIDPVMERYGSFFSNLQLNAIAVDDDENLYIIETSNVYKITPDREKTTIGQVEGIVYDARTAPSGELILLLNNSIINQMDITTGEVTKWAEVAKSVRYGDFDSQGNFGFPSWQQTI